MFNPRHSFISTSSATTYPSTLSPPRTSSIPLGSPTSPRQNHPHRLHRSSKRNLRPSASSSALKAIIEDGKAGQGKMLSHRMSTLTLAPGATRQSDPSVTRVAPASAAQSSGRIPPARPASQLTPESRPPPRPASAETVQAWAQRVNDIQKASSRPTSTVQSSNSAVKPTKPSRDESKSRVPTQHPRPPTQSSSLGLGLVTSPSVQDPSKTPNPVARVAHSRKPEPINVNPKKQDSFADEWERELIASAKNPHFELPDPKGKGREVQNDIEWERSGRWQADVDPTREAEDMKRRDNGREIGKSTFLILVFDGELM